MVLNKVIDGGVGGAYCSANIVMPTKKGCRHISSRLFAEQVLQVDLLKADEVLRKVGGVSLSFRWLKA